MTQTALPTHVGSNGAGAMERGAYISPCGRYLGLPETLSLAYPQGGWEQRR